MKLTKFRLLVLSVLSVLLVGLPVVGSPAAEAQSGSQSLDAQRLADIGEIIEAYEAYGEREGSYRIAGGFRGRGYGSFSYVGGSDYRFSLAGGLVDAGVMDAAEVPVEPSGRGYAVWLCRNRVGVFSPDDTLTPAPADVAWWNANCPGQSLSQLTQVRTYFELSDPYGFEGPTGLSPVSTVVAAFDAYMADRNTFVVTDSGASGGGWGWFSRRHQSEYKASILDELVVSGYLNHDSPPENPAALARYWDGMYITWCAGRLAVFALPSAASGTTPSAADAAFWSSNNCPTWMMSSSWKLTYFKLSEKLDSDLVRVEGAREIVAAMEAAANATHSPLLDGMGYEDKGTGWYSLETGISYKTSIAHGLAAGGFLNPYDLPAEDPWISAGYDRGYLSFQCKNRRAVFTRSNGITPSPADAAWWTANGCPMPTSTAHTYFVLTEPLPLDQIRRRAVTKIIDVLEEYGRDHFTYRVAGTGYQQEGYGAFNARNSLYYTLSIEDGLRQAGYLEPGVVVREPLSRDGHDSNGLRVYQCKDRVAVFSLADSIAPTAQDVAWWADNGCTTAGTAGGRSYFQVSAPLPLDEARSTAMDTVLAAFEAYGAEYGTFAIQRAGYQGNGAGWFSGGLPDYDPNVGDALAEAGYLDPANMPEDPLVDRDAQNGLRVELCNGRVGVFALSNGAQPSQDDEAWWAANNCTRLSIDTHNHRYFKLSRPIEVVHLGPTADDLRQAAVAQAVAALESYGTDNGTYAVAGAGDNGSGQGWYQLSDTGAYASSIAQTLIGGGHLTGPLLTDPLDVDPATHSERDLMVYTCADRVGVFARTDQLVTYNQDAAWWADNDCDTTPIDTHDHTFFVLSTPLDTLDDPYIVTYSASALPGYKTATVRVQPQNGPIAVAYATLLVVGPAPAPVAAVFSGAPSGVTAAAVAARSTRCGEGAHCGSAPDGKIHAVGFNQDGWSSAFNLVHHQIGEDQELTVEMATVTIEELIHPDANRADFQHFLEINGVYAPSIRTGPKFDEYVGLDSTLGTNLARCDGDMGTWWNYATVNLTLPNGVELQRTTGGLVWTWDSVPNSRDCYDWKSWANYKNGSRATVPILRFDSGPAAFVPQAQLTPGTAELCLAVTPVTWIDHPNRTNYYSPHLSLYDGNEPPWREVCVPAPRGWGDADCDGDTDTDDVWEGLRRVLTGQSPCSSDFVMDVNWDGVVDFLDVLFVLGCRAGVSFNKAVDLDACDRLDANPRDAGTVANATRVDESTISVEVPASSDGSPVLVKVTIDGVVFRQPTAAAPGRLTINLPPETKGEVCVTISTGAPFPSKRCFDFFTVAQPVCGSRLVNVEVKNNSRSTRTYVVTATAPQLAPITKSVSIQAGGVRTVSIGDSARYGDYQISVTQGGAEIAGSQSARTSQCAQIISDCSGRVEAQLDNVGNDSAEFALTVTWDGATVSSGTVQVAPDAQGTIVRPGIIYGHYDIEVTRNGVTVYSDRHHVGDGCLFTDVCPSAQHAAVCATAENLFVDVETAAALLRVAGLTEPIVAFGGIEHRSTGVSAFLNQAAHSHTLDNLRLFARIAITQTQLDRLAAQEHLALQARIAHLAGLTENPISGNQLGLTMELGGSDAQHTVIRNEHGVVVLAYLPSSGDLSQSTEFYRLRLDWDPTSRHYQQLLDMLDDGSGAEMAGAAAFALSTTGDRQLADALLATALPCACPTAVPGGGSGVHTWLDWAGFVPLLGEPADFINGTIYLVEGDTLNAGISFAALIPVAGSAGTGTRVARSVPLNRLDEFLGSSPRVDNAGRLVLPGSSGRDVLVVVAQGTELRTVVRLVPASPSRLRIETLASRISTNAISDLGLRLHLARALDFLPAGQQNQLLALVNASAPDTARRIAANAAIDPVATAAILRQPGGPDLAREILGGPFYEQSLVALDGATSQAALLTRDMLDGLATSGLSANDMNRAASLIYQSPASRLIVVTIGDTPESIHDVVRLLDDPDHGQLFTDALASTNPDWADDLIWGATRADTPDQRYFFFNDVLTQGNSTSSLPKWLQDVRAGRQFNDDRNAVYRSQYGAAYRSELYLNAQPPYVRVDGWIRPGPWSEFPLGAIISRKNTQYATLADPYATARTHISELRTKYADGTPIANVPSSGDLGGNLLRGTLVLEIPPQTSPLDPRILAWAAGGWIDPVTGDEVARVVIRDTDGHIYNPL